MPQNLQINIQYYGTDDLERIYETFRLLLKILRERDAPKDEVKSNNFVFFKYLLNLQSNASETYLEK